MQYHLVAPIWYQGAIIIWHLDTHNINRACPKWCGLSIWWNRISGNQQIGDGKENANQCYIWNSSRSLDFLNFLIKFSPCFSSLWGQIGKWHKDLLLIGQHFLVPFCKEITSECCRAPLLAFHQLFKGTGGKTVDFA